MRKFLLTLFLSLLISGNAMAAWTNFDYTPVNQAEAIESANCDEFPEVFPTGDADVVELQYRVGVDRETTAGDIYNLTYTISTDTYGSATALFECPDSALDATNPTKGQIGTTLFTIINCKDTGNTDGISYIYTRAVSGAINSWTLRATIDFPSHTGNAWGNLVATSDANTYFWPISQNTPATAAIRQLRTTDGGATWAMGPDIVTSPSKWSEAALAYVPGVGHVGFVRNDDGDRVNYIKSTDGLGEVWSAPAPISSNAYGAATGTKISQIYWDEDTGTLLGTYADRGDGNILYAMTAKPYQAFNGEWNTPRQIGTTGFGNQVFYEKDTTTKTFMVWLGNTGTGDCQIDDIQYRNLLQTLTFKQIGP